MTFFGRTAWRLHITLVIGLAGCGIASWIEWRRALSGHLIAWAYAFEWPLFAVMGTWVWWRLLRGTDGPAASSRAPRGDGRGRSWRRILRPTAVVAPDDPQLLAWQDYVARLHAADPPGGPPG